MKSHKQLWFVRAAFGSLVLAALAIAQTRAVAYGKEDNKDLKHRDVTFIKEAAQGGMAEAQLGQFAVEKAQNKQVKQLGRRIHTDHNKANEELQRIAQKLGVTLPTELERKYRKHVDDLQSKSGAEFDKAFAEHMIKDHKKDIKEFEKAARDAENADVKSFAERTLPTLREHLRLAQDAGRAVGLTGSLVTSIEEDKSVGRSSAGTTGRETSTKANEK